MVARQRPVLPSGYTLPSPGLRLLATDFPPFGL
jgi:hypothetical protein